MKLNKINATLASLQENMGSGLIATSIWAPDGESIADINPQPKASALFDEVTDYLIKALNESGFPALNQYYYLDLVDNKAMLVILYGKFQQGILIDTSKVKLGVLLNVDLPELIEALSPELD